MPLHQGGNFTYGLALTCAVNEGKVKIIPPTGLKIHKYTCRCAAIAFARVEKPARLIAKVAVGRGAVFRNDVSVGFGNLVKAVVAAGGV